MIRKRSKPESKKKRAWELEVDADEDSETAAPSEAFLSLQKELDEKEKIQRENEHRAEKQEALIANAAKRLQEKEKLRRVNAKNPKVFLDIEIADVTGAGSRLRKGTNIGRITIEVFEDALPQTAENFRALCTGEKPRGASGFPLSYLGNIFHRIVPKFMAQGGDITREDGSGGESIYGPTFADESFGMKHDRPGLLSMANSGRNTNNSQFFITFNPLPWLDSKHVVFGKVVDGMEIVRKIEDCGTSSGEPTKRVQIAECGQIRDEDEGEKINEDEGEEDKERRSGGKRQRVRFAESDDVSGERRDGPVGEDVVEGAGSVSAIDEGRRNGRVRIEEDE